MKQLDFDRAFPQTPDCIHAAIEMGFRKGQKQMKIRNKIITLSSIAAALMIMFAATLAAGGLNIAPKPDVLVQPEVTDIPRPTEEPMVWCTEKGNYYHSEEHCSGMEGAIYGTLSYALALDKAPCPVCITSNAESLSEPQLNPAETATSMNESATSMADIDANLSFLGTITQIDRLYQAAFGNLEEAVAAGYGFMPEIAENYWMLTNGQQTVLSLNYQEVGSDPSLEAKWILNVMLNNGREISNRFMESIRNYPISFMYPMAIDAARDHMKEIQPENAEAFDPYVEAILLEFDETFQMQNCKIQFPCAMNALYVEFQVEEREDGGRSWDVKTYTKTT